MTMEARHIITTYRLDRQSILDLCQQLRHLLLPSNRNRRAITPLVKVLSVLHFLATGSFQHTVGLCGGMSQSMFCRVLGDVLAAMLSLMGTYIKFPEVVDFPTVKAGFYALGGIPHVVGAIDGTHVPLVPPHGREQVYRNRKNYYSINVQVVSLSDCYISHVFAAFPGSAHDSYVLRNSSLPQTMAQLQAHRAMIVGDSAYPNNTWLLAPVRNARTPAEDRYNVAHGRTRRVVERTFGLLKARFRCLDRTGGALMYSPEKVCKIVAVCCMLHNVTVRRHIPVPPQDEAQPQQPMEDEQADGGDGSGEDEAEDVRQDLIATYFS